MCYCWLAQQRSVPSSQLSCALLTLPSQLPCAIGSASAKCRSVETDLTTLCLRIALWLAWRDGFLLLGLESPEHEEGFAEL